MATVQDMLLQLRYLLNEDTASLWTDTELLRHINDAQRDIASRTGCTIKQRTVSTTSGSREVPFTGHKVLYVEYQPDSSDPVALIPITPKMLGNVQTYNGIIPQYYFQWGQNIIIDPQPQAVYTLSIYTAMWPDCNLSDNADEPTIATAFHESMKLFVQAAAFYKPKKVMKTGLFYRQYLTSTGLLKRIYSDERPDQLQDIKMPDLVTAETREERGE